MRMIGRVQGGMSRRVAPRMLGFATLGTLVFTAARLRSNGKDRRRGTEKPRPLQRKEPGRMEARGPGRFLVRNGLLETEDGMGLLSYAREKIGRARLRVEFKMEGKEPDSGVFIRIPEKPTEPWMVNRGYKVEIGDWPSDYFCTGVLYTFTKALARPLKPLGNGTP